VTEPAAPQLSIVIPVFDEKQNLHELFARLLGTLDAFGRSYEIVFTDDGSRDGSLDLLLALRAQRPDRVVVIEFSRNFGQHMAVLAGLREARGEIVVTLDADLQNPPEEIPRLVMAAEAGHDVVGTYRESRQDGGFRRIASRLANALRSRLTVLPMRDHGCMLRAYRREVVDAVLQSRETSTFVPALAMLYAARPTELQVAHAPRAGGHSKYGLYRLIRLYFDLMTGFSAAPLQVFTLIGLAVSLLSGSMVVVLAVRRIVIGPEVEGIFTLMGILFFLMGVAITGLGIIGEYIARIYHEVRRRPPYVVRRVHGHGDA
jgi:undecaprenyl-phosphate 4-deoxy-4-formamido-L-arabinose transferase